MQRDPGLVRGMAFALAGVLLLDLVVAGVVASLLAPWTASVVDALAAAAGIGTVPDGLRFGLLALLGVGVLAWAQLRYTRDRLLATVDARPVGSDTHPDLLARVRRLASLADAEPPAVAVVDSDVPNCFSIGGVGAGTIVVSEGLLDLLDDDELDAVLAHELAHLLNRDAVVLTLSSFLPVLVDDRPAGILDRVPGPLSWAAVAIVGYPLSAGVIDAPLFSAAHAGAFLVLVVAAVLLGGLVVGAGAVAMAALSRRLARTREFAADRAAALLTGRPAALASALETLDEGAERPARDVRSGDVATLCLLPHGFGAESIETGDEEGFVVETAAHPPTHERIRRLRELASDLERQ